MIVTAPLSLHFVVITKNSLNVEKKPVCSLNLLLELCHYCSMSKNDNNPQTRKLFNNNKFYFLTTSLLCDHL